MRNAKMSLFIGGLRFGPPLFRLGVFPLGLRRVEVARLRLLAGGRLVRVEDVCVCGNRHMPSWQVKSPGCV